MTRKRNKKYSIVNEKEIFNALVEKIEILTPAHFVFELKSGMRVEGAMDAYAGFV
jgi:hypothetical protein